MYVIGTAGHVDHGKSALVRALTGIDPDRLREEKERGLTIDLGFAWLTLPSGREVSVVDVPGHERFIKNMLAGAGGIDLALLVVAADEGPMPQTREHLAILDLLDIPTGIVVISKCDLAEPDYLDLVEADLEETLAGTRLAGAPMVRTSATTGEGLGALCAAIDRALDAIPPKRNLGQPRLPVDRAFSAQGFGAVVTGTLIDGALETGQEVELQPGGLRARVRGLQRHRMKVARLEPGTRAAVNLSGIRASDVRRGMVVALPGRLRATTVVDVHVRAPAILSHPLAHDAGITFLSATAETQGRIRLLDCDELEAGQAAWAQVVLDDPVAVVPGDHCVIRTPNETACGGVIVAIDARRHRRRHPPTLAALELLREGSAADRLAGLLAAGPAAPSEVAARLTLEPAGAAALVADALGEGVAAMLGDRLAGTPWLESASQRLATAVGDYLAANHLRPSAPREHVRSALGFEPAVFDGLVARALAAGSLAEFPGGGLAPPGYQPALTPAERAQAEAFLAALAAGGTSPPTEGVPAPPLLAYLVASGRVEDAGAGVVFDAAVFARMVETVRAHLAAHGTISLAETRDLFATSRKYAQAFLEHLDGLRITRRQGDVRVLRTGGGP